MFFLPLYIAFNLFVCLHTYLVADIMFYVLFVFASSLILIRYQNHASSFVTGWMISFSVCGAALKCLSDTRILIKRSHWTENDGIQTGN